MKYTLNISFLVFLFLLFIWVSKDDPNIREAIIYNLTQPDCAIPILTQLETLNLMEKASENNYR